MVHGNARQGRSLVTLLATGCPLDFSALYWLLSALVVQCPPHHLSTSLPLNALLVTQHSTGCHESPGRRCRARAGTGTLCQDTLPGPLCRSWSSRDILIGAGSGIGAGAEQNSQNKYLEPEARPPEFGHFPLNRSWSQNRRVIKFRARVGMLPWSCNGSR